MRRYRWIAAVPILAATFAAPAGAQVASNGFVVRHEVTIDAHPTKVYEVLTGQIGSWWSPDHTYSGDAANLRIEPRAGGCFCETLPNGGGVEHGRVVLLIPGQVFRLVGSLGPLQQEGLAGSLTFNLSNVAGATKVEMVYSVGGFLAGGFERLAPVVAAVLREQLLRLESFIETGTPARAAAR